MTVSDAQVRRLMEEHAKSGKVGLAAMKARMDRKTARKYLGEAKLPSELKRPRKWRTRADPFVEDWPALEARLVDAPELEAKTLFEHLLAEHPERYEPGQLRTLQRRIQEWRAKKGPEREIFFAQEHRPGEAMQTDFTHCEELSVTFAGEPFPHLLCHPVLPYSNWEWATVCHSESLMALRRGVQAALFKLGRVPEWHQTDNSTHSAETRPSRPSPRKRATNITSAKSHCLRQGQLHAAGLLSVESAYVWTEGSPLLKKRHHLLLPLHLRDEAGIRKWVCNTLLHREFRIDSIQNAFGGLGCAGGRTGLQAIENLQIASE